MKEKLQLHIVGSKDTKVVHAPHNVNYVHLVFVSAILHVVYVI